MHGCWVKLMIPYRTCNIESVKRISFMVVPEKCLSKYGFAQLNSALDIYLTVTMYSLLNNWLNIYPETQLSICR